MVDLKAAAANVIAPGSGFFVKLADKAKEMKDSAVDAARNAKKNISDRLAKVSTATNVAAAQAGYAPSKKMWAQPAIVFLVALVLFLYFRFLGMSSLANWIMISAVTAIVIGIVFKEPGKGLFFLFIPPVFWLLDKFSMWTPANSAIALGIVVLVFLGTFQNARIFVDKILTVLAFVFGGILLFWLSAWAQMQLNTPVPHFITTGLILGYFCIIAFMPSKDSQGKPTMIKWVALLVNILFFSLIIVTPGLFAPPNSPLSAAIESQRQAWYDSYNYVFKAGQQVAKGLETQIYIATGDYEQGVETQSQKPLGVFLENIGVTSPVVQLGDKIDVYARLRVESFKTGGNLTVNVKCYPEGVDFAKGNITPRARFSVEEYEMQEIDCIINSADAGLGSPLIVLETSFDFTTSAFLKSYFMDQETIRSMRRNQVDPLDAFKITDKNPVARFTGGPLMIGMGAGQQPVALVKDSSDNFGPTLSITLDKNWAEGEFGNVTSLSIIVPPGLKIEDVDGEKVSNCVGGKDKEQTCVLDGVILSKLFKPPVATPKTVRVHTKLEDMNVLLANAPLAIRSFKTTVTYSYVVKKKIGVNVQQKRASP
ncbi:Uncharacterised protein [uncultured archaeon]|nr:Uncharacterised protein [uncultured archaeon]